MTDLLIHTEIGRLVESLDGELTTHSRVIDGLLDVRSACESAHLVDVIDTMLRTVPGKTAVATDWFRGQLASLSVMAELSLVEAPEGIIEDTAVLVGPVAPAEMLSPGPSA